MVSRAFHLENSREFAQKALAWANRFDHVCYFDSNGHRDNYGNIDVLLAVGQQATFESENRQDTFDQLQKFVNQHPNTWIPGFLGYDLKNELEDLQTRHPNHTRMPDAYFFVPQYTLLIGQYNVEVQGENAAEIIAQIKAMPSDVLSEPIGFHGTVLHRMTRNSYFDAFNKIQEHIQRGDCYEINLCQEFYAEEATLNPLGLFQKLNERTPAPFTCFFKNKERYILSASPERFISKQGNRLLSQPIKGTAPRGRNPAEDTQFKTTLRNSQKELSENIMIVDLVRHDLTKSALPATVKTPELTKVYSFSQVHQLISTVTATHNPNIPITQVIAHAFPPGSMTGAPKVKTLELIDLYEQSRRGVYSGALGYFGPQKNFDFSVVIRSLIYHSGTGYLSFHTGGAITAQSVAEQEYDECLLKGKALFELLDNESREH